VASLRSITSNPVLLKTLETSSASLRGFSSGPTLYEALPITRANLLPNCGGIKFGGGVLRLCSLALTGAVAKDDSPIPSIELRIL